MASSFLSEKDCCVFLSYRRADSPVSVKALYERLTSRLPLWNVFYDHHDIEPGEEFPERLRKEVTSAKVVLVTLGPRWVQLLKVRATLPGVDHVREEVRLALQAGNTIIPVLVENAVMPSAADLADFPDVVPLLGLNARSVRPDPDFDTDVERLAAFLDKLGPGVGPGTILAGKYKIVRTIGQGGMGIVYEAEQLEPRRNVAIKMIVEGMDTKDVLARFDGEKEALARLDHPNVARVIDSGRSPGGKPYFVMDLVKGEPITQYCDHKRLPPEERLKLFQEVCAGVQHAHQKAIVHRDIKPTNVLVEEIDGQPTVKVIDFGLAKALAGRLTDKTVVSELGKTVGTLPYASPEQAAGRQHDIDTRTDVYSLGVLLYELLTGEPPFSARELAQKGEEAMRREIIEKEPSKPSVKLSSSNALPTLAANRRLEPAKLTRLVRGDLDWIALKALDKEPQHRYVTPSALAEDIEHYLASEPISAGKPSQLHRFRKLVRRNQGAAIAALLIFTALLIGVIGTTLGLLEARRQAELARRETDQKNKALGEKETQRRFAVKAKEDEADARMKAEALTREASRSDFSTAQARFAEGKWQEGIAYLGRALRYDRQNANARDALWLAAFYGARDAGRMPRFEVHHKNAVFWACFNADGTRIVTASGDDTARIWDTATGQPISGPLRHQDDVNGASFSPDGTRIVTASRDHTARVWDAATGQPIAEPLRHDDLVYHASFSPDGTRIVTASSDGTARIWHTASGQQVGGPLRHQREVNGASFSPDGTRIVTASWDDTARIWDTATGQPIAEPLRHDNVVTSASFSPDGTRIATASWDHTARVWGAATAQPIAEPLRHDNWVMSASFSPDGTRIVTASWDRTARVWDAATGQPITDPLRHDRGVCHASFSPDGTRIVTASSDKTARIWHAASGQPIAEPLRHDGRVCHASFSPDGTRIVTASDDKTTRVWNAASGQPIAEPLRYDHAVYHASFSPDGTRIITASGDDIARILDTASGQPIAEPIRHDGRVCHASFSPDGTRIVTASDDKTARVWDAASGQPIAEPLRHDDGVYHALFSADGARIVTASFDKTARIWDAASGQPIAEPLRHDDVVISASFSPDGTRIVTASWDRTARVWDAATGQPIAEPVRHDNGVTSASFSPDGTRIVTASLDDTARIWDTATGQPIAEPLRHDNVVTSASFSPDGTRIVTASWDDTARIWDTATGQPTGGPLRHQGSVNGASFSPDGTRIVTASDDNTARVWDAATGQPIGGPLRHQDDVKGASFSPDGRWIATTARVWEWKPLHDLDDSISPRFTCTLAGANLDPKLGTLHLLPYHERLALWQELEPALTKSREWLFLARAAFPRSPDSAVSPRSSMTLREAASQLIRTGNDGCIREALSIDPGHPLIQIAFAALEDQTQSMAEFLREYGVARLPENAAICREAAEMLIRQKDRARASRALDKAAKLDPQHPDVARLRVALEKLDESPPPDASPDQPAK